MSGRMTSRKLKEMSEMWERGISPGDMALVYGMNPDTLWTYIRRNRDLFPHRRHHADWWRERLKTVEGLSSRDAALRLGVSYETICSWRRKLA